MFEFFDTLMQWLNVDIYNLLKDFVVYLISSLTVLYFEAKIAILTFSWSVAKAVINEINVSQYIDAAWGHLDSTTLNTLMFFKVPDALNLILAAYPTRMILRFIGL